MVYSTLTRSHPGITRLLVLMFSVFVDVVERVQQDQETENHETFYYTPVHIHLVSERYLKRRADISFAFTR